MPGAETPGFPLAGALRLAGSSLGWLGRIGLDGIGERGETALPRTPAQISDCETLNRLLSAGRPMGGVALPAVSGVNLPGVDFESSNCTNFLLEVDFADEDAGKTLPRSVYVKLPCPEMATRVFGNTLGFWDGPGAPLGSLVDKS